MVKKIESDAPLSYAAYIRLPSILSSQIPQSPRESIGVWTAERYFIVCHQISELLASQILADLECAAGLMDSPQDWCTVKELLVRAASLALQFYQQSEQLAFLCPQRAFLGFRPFLEGASAIESEQFRQLLHISTGVHPQVKTLEQALRRQQDSPSTSFEEAITAREGDAWSIAEALSILENAIRLWRELHIAIAAYFIAGAHGTGGTAGWEYLVRRMQKSSENKNGTSHHSSGSSGHLQVFCDVSMKDISARALVLHQRVRMLQPAVDEKIGTYLAQAGKV